MESLKILFIGNSFSLDTAEYTVEIAHALGISNVKVTSLYIGGCSIALHYDNAMQDLPAYRYYTNTGEGWDHVHEHKLSDAVREDDWDWIVFQQGTNDGSRYTSPESYAQLTPLIRHVKQMASPHARIAFNLTWMGESTRQHHEILSYGGDIAAMRQKLEEVTREVILGNPLIDLLVPTGTAIENARTSAIGLLTRDCYHLSMDKGRYIAALTFISVITDLPVDGIDWCPAGVDAYAKQVAIESANHAKAHPLEITPSSLFKR